VRAGYLATAFAITMLVGMPANAQIGPGGGGGAPSGPTQSRPTQQRQVGPRAGAQGDEDDEPRTPQRAEPAPQTPADPLEMSEETRARIGSDYDAPPPEPTGPATERSYLPLYSEKRDGVRFRFLPPLYLEHTRFSRAPNETRVTRDRESLFGLLYYQRRSPDVDADVLFPLAWRVRDRENRVLVLGPLAHREAPNETDNWLAPLYFVGSRKDGGYFHIPPLLTTSRWGEKSAFTLVGPYFRDRKGTDVDAGVVPFYFRGDNGDTEGGRKTYTLIPPLFYYHREREYDENRLTVVGPVLSETNPKRDILDVFPFYYSIRGKPESGGVHESHTTLFPFFHYGYDPEKSLFVVPGYLRRTTRTSDTILTPIYSQAETRNGATKLTAIGPIVPVYWHYRDRDLGTKAFAIAPLYFQTTSPTGRGFLTPLVGRFESYGVSRTWWLFPTFQYTTDTTGWAFNIHPLLYLGRDGTASHTVIAPFFWDFTGKSGRATVGFPVYWRFADSEAGTVTQVAANTLYLEKRVPGGREWSFHLLPLFSYGENPQGYFWNILFGLAGYERAGSYGRVKAFWLPITVSSPSAPSAPSAPSGAKAPARSGNAFAPGSVSPFRAAPYGTPERF
jgi:hypothetical protein